MIQLIIAGTGLPEVIGLVEDINLAIPGSIELLGFIDDNLNNQTRQLYGYHFLGAFDVISQFPAAYIVNTISRSSYLRFSSTQRLLSLGARFTNLLHPSIQIKGSITGVGNIIFSGVHIELGSSIHSHNLFLKNVIIGHDSVVSSYCFLGHNAVVNGHSAIADYCFVGANSVLGPSVNISEKVSIAPSLFIGVDHSSSSVLLPRSPIATIPSSGSQHYWPSEV